ncbi:MAG: hypothetical protein J5659_05025 [Clostridia bacterium]|nr:hypothetical protein [Clostridia bacterium]
MHKKVVFFRGFITAALFIIVAFACHSIARRTDFVALSRFLNFIRTSIYIGLFSFWGVTAHRRVVQGQVRKYLVCVSALMVLWIILREYKFRFVLDTNVERYLWYSYYIPLLLTPLLALFVSVLLGKNEAYRLPERYKLLYVPTVFLIFLFLTNDFHGLAFRFSPTAVVLSEHGSYSYGIVFYAAVAWGILCSLTAMVIMIYKSKPVRLKGLFWLPLAPVVLVILYVILYASRVPIIAEQGDIAVFFGIVFISFFEICIRLRMISSNTRYFDLFKATKELSLQIVDRSYTVRYLSADSEKFDKDILISAQSAPIIIPNGKMLHNMPISGGHAIWVQDVSEILHYTEELKNAKAELRDRNEIIRLEYEDIKRKKEIEEQNRLYDLIQSVTQSQLDKVMWLSNEYIKSKGEAKKSRIISEIVVLGSYIKRRRDFLLSMQSAAKLSTDKLKSALDESFRSLRLLKIAGGYAVHTNDNELSADVMTLIYDFFEDCLESVIKDVKFISVVVASLSDLLRVSIVTDFFPDKSKRDLLYEKYPGSRISFDEADSAQFLLTVKGGADK